MLKEDISMKTTPAQASGKQECEGTDIYASEMDMPIAKRTRLAQRARWQDNSKNVQRKQVLAIELHAPRVLNGEHLNYYQKKGKTESFHSNKYRGGQCRESSTGCRDSRKIGVEVKRRGRPNKCIRDSPKVLQLRILPYGMKEIHKSQRWLKKHRKQNVFDDEERKYIQELVKVEVQKQIMQLMNIKVKPVGNQKQPTRKNVTRKGHHLRNSRREEARKCEARAKKGFSQLSNIQENKLVVDLEEEEKFGDLVFEVMKGNERQGLQIESIERLELVTKQGITETDKDRQSDETGFCMEMKKFMEEKMENSVNNTMKPKKCKNVPVPNTEKIGLPFQHLVVDIQTGEETLSKHEDLSEDSKELIVKARPEAAADLDEMRKNMDVALKGDPHDLDNKIDIGMSENDKLKNLNHDMGEGNGMVEKDKLNIIDHDMDEGKEIQMTLSKSEVVEFNEQSKDSNVHIDIKKLGGGENNVDSNARPMKRSRESVLDVQEIKLPFQRLLLNIQQEAKMP